jgi:alanine racemase
MRRCWVEIHLSELEHNLQCIRSMVPSHVKIISVVKADAYGHGIHATVARLMQSGTDIFAVANVQEGASIREMGSGWPILTLSPLLPEEIPACIENNITPTISTYQEAEAINKVASIKKSPIQCHFKIDTGMGRLGIWYEQALEEYIKISKLHYIRIQGIYTHFATSDTDIQFTHKQRELFLSIIDHLPNLPKDCIFHADNSAGLDSFSPEGGRLFNAVRVGLLQFGAQARENSLLQFYNPKPTLSFHTRIGLIKKVPSGTPISYNLTHRVDHETTLAIITAGYADGIPLSISNRGSVLIQGKKCRILGRVTMDQIIVDVDHLNNPQCGDEVVLIGQQGKEKITLEEFSKNAQSIPWEILCSISKRVERIYKTVRQ